MQALSRSTFYEALHLMRTPAEAHNQPPSAATDVLQALQADPALVTYAI